MGNQKPQFRVTTGKPLMWTPESAKKWIKGKLNHAFPHFLPTSFHILQSEVLCYKGQEQRNFEKTKNVTKMKKTFFYMPFSTDYGYLHENGMRVTSSFAQY